MRNELAVKETNFNGDLLKVAQDLESKKMYVGVSWVCNAIGFSKSQKDAQVQKIQTDFVLNRGCLKFQSGVFDANNESLAIELDFLPLWLAKVSITPKMIEEKPDITQKLVSYQLKAKDVLAKAFINSEEVNLNNFDIPKTLSEALLLSANLAKENEEMKPKAEQFDLYINSDGTLSLNQVAKALKTHRNKMMKFLRCQKIFNQDNSPSQRYSDMDYFSVKTFVVVTKSNRKFEVTRTRVTPKGQDFLFRYLKNHIDEYSEFDNEFASKINVEVK